MSDYDDVEETDGSDEGTADRSVGESSFVLVEDRRGPPSDDLNIHWDFLGWLQNGNGPSHDDDRT